MKLLLLSIVALNGFEIKTQELHAKRFSPENQPNSSGKVMVSFEENITQTSHSIH